MNSIKSFFEQRGFVFEQSLESTLISIEKNENLSQKLIGKVFYYQNLSQAKTSFYLVDEELDKEELNDFRNFVWNENKIDLFITKEIKKNNLFSDNDNLYLKICFAKNSPKDNLIYEVISSDDNQEIIDKINKWQFDSGAFWFNFNEFFDKIKTSKTQKIDKELIHILKELKKQLSKNIIENNPLEKEKIVQALIDRTLYIKYLEDNHIINSYFYYHYFEDKSKITYDQFKLNQEFSKTNYKGFLEIGNAEKLNRLFEIINKIFNNNLFKNPKIDDNHLNSGVCNLIFNSIIGTNQITGQLRLFDFKFNLLPIEFISYIYEIFLSDNERKGIYYTPKKLAQLIVDEVINENKIGRVLDPSCGSGMFLVVAYQKLLEISPIPENGSVEEKIEHKLKLLTDNIFGIEKELIAQRFTIFSLSLQVFRGINPADIKNYIAKELEENGNVGLFNKYSLEENIKRENALDFTNPIFKNEVFDYIVGNPPFFEIKPKSEEISYLKSSILIDNKQSKVIDIVEDNQISQCFLLKINDWSNNKTRFGFVSNSSNFFDDLKKFEKFFFKNYQVEKLYELSKVKDSLFESAVEGVSALIFNRYFFQDNFIKYYSIDLGLFSDKPFELLVIQEDKVVLLSQKDIIEDKIRLRDYLIGNEFDIKLINEVNKNSVELGTLMKKHKNGKPIIHTGLQIAGVESVLKEFNITRETYDKDKKEYLNTFRDKYTRVEKDNKFKIPLIRSKDISPFVIENQSVFVENTNSFRRKGKNEGVFEGNKILLTRVGDTIKAIFVEEKIYFEIDIYTLKLEDESLYLFITALLNSSFLNYYINLCLRKRIHSSYSRIGIDEITKIPVPKILDEDLLIEVNKTIKNIINKKLKFEQVEEKLNNLIFELYDFSYIEKTRIKDYFKKKAIVTNSELEIYKTTLFDSLNVFFKNPIRIESYTSLLNITGIKINFAAESDESNPDIKKAVQFLINEIFKNNSDVNFLASQEKIFGKDCIYIIKKDLNQNWSETKALEDSQEILKRFMNGK